MILHPKSEDEMDALLGNLLRAGVVLAAAVAAAGGIAYLLRHGLGPVDYSVFRGEPADLRSLRGIMADMLALRPGESSSSGWCC